ncbi:competence type IV pilus assembly protein ComGB [Shouchella hunanensis]|uniref:Competence type IV pilus assembly protein ComGB n=1 Tax=Shouchella hunanensis TaxID=766894 RepID=A0ABY7WBB7_9BACI|nr:competence type IV pilus assembly protein ComGB [Shouchella hunanensis]WDF03990.1 competence type IV pilus assembly protein ComGB [Shouchella hunanensis]
MIKKRKRMTKLMKISFIMKLGELLQSGYSTEQALSFLSVQSTKETQRIIQLMEHKLTKGEALSSSLLDMELPLDVQSYIFFYEEQGKAAEGLMEASKLYQKRLQTSLQLQKLVRYPLVLLFGAIVALVLLNLYIVPHFQSLFVTMNQTPPRFIKYFFAFLTNLPIILASFLLFAIMMYAVFRKYVQKQTPHEKVRLLMKWKPTNTMIRQVITFYFSLQLGKLLQTGMSIHEAIFIFEKQSYMPFFKDEANQINQSLKDGYSLAVYLETQPYYMEELRIIVENGSRTGKLASDLQFFSSWILEELDQKIERGLQAVQPLLFLFIGSFIFFLFLIIMLPMYEMFNLM